MSLITYGNDPRVRPHKSGGYAVTRGGDTFYVLPETPGSPTTHWALSRTPTIGDAADVFAAGPDVIISMILSEAPAAVAA